MKQIARFWLFIMLVMLLYCGTSCDRQQFEILATAVAPSGQRWAATKNGLFVDNSEGKLMPMPVPSLTRHPYPCIRALVCDSARGFMWIGAWNHLYCYDLNSNRFLTISDSTVYRTVALKCDSLGRVLAWTERGLFRLTLSDYFPAGMVEQLDNAYYPINEIRQIDSRKWVLSQKSNHRFWLILLLVLLVVIPVAIWMQRRRKQQAQVSVSPAAAPLRADFLDRANSIVDKNISNENFTPELFAQEMAMSRAQLFRKLKSASGLTVMEFINEHRLLHAAQLLKTTDRTLADIAEKCGFSDPSNFRRSFLKRFGENPSEYRKTD